METTEFLDRTNYEWRSPWHRASGSLRLLERFRQVSADTMVYTITVEVSACAAGIRESENS